MQGLVASEPRTDRCQLKTRRCHAFIALCCCAPQRILQRRSGLPCGDADMMQTVDQASHNIGGHCFRRKHGRQSKSDRVGLRPRPLPCSDGLSSPLREPSHSRDFARGTPWRLDLAQPRHERRLIRRLIARRLLQSC